jgi:hypothetical protein
LGGPDAILQQDIPKSATKAIPSLRISHEFFLGDNRNEK